MIKENNTDNVTKATQNLAKLTLYLLFYIHCLACYWWIAVGLNAPKQYFYHSDKNLLISEDEEVYQVDDKIYYYDGAVESIPDIKWGK